jgi:D-ornithine 4,5-aminomutase subunit beta
VPWHIYNIEGTDTAKQAFSGMDGLMEMVQLRRDEGELADNVRELKERAVLYMEEMLELGGYFQAVEAGMFVDSGKYPERNGDPIVRKIDGGIGAGTVYERDDDYMAPVTAHFGYNNLEAYGPEAAADPSSLIGGSTFEDPDKIVFIDELDETDNVNVRMAETAELRGGTRIKPEMEWQGDGTVLVTLFLPTDERTAKVAALEVGRAMNLSECEVIHSEVMHPSEGTRIELKGVLDLVIDTCDAGHPAGARPDDRRRTICRHKGPAHDHRGRYRRGRRTLGGPSGDNRHQARRHRGLRHRLRVPWYLGTPGKTGGRRHRG